MARPHIFGKGDKLGGPANGDGEASEWASN
jgi:hypothetical protein